MTDWTSQNKATFAKGCTAYIKNIATPQLVNILKQKAQELVTAIAGDTIPVYTANLRDATGCAVYVNGSLTSYLPITLATKEQSSGFNNKNVYHIKGSEYLLNAINIGSKQFSKGLWFVIFSAVPYAYYIDLLGSPWGRGKGFFEKIINTTKQEILAGLRPVSKLVTI